jgi:acyl dehydratase
MTAPRSGEALPELHHDVSSTTIVLGALATRDWRPQHHDFHFATERNGVRDIFMSAPNQAAWFERYLTDWAGPRARLGRMAFQMHDSVFPGDRMRLAGRVSEISDDTTGCRWASVTVELTVDDRLCTTCTARVALPAGPDDNPWSRRGERWQP